MPAASPLLPQSVVPLLESVVRSPLVRAGLPTEFWRHDDQHAWVDAFMELATALVASELYEDTLPRGYGLIAHLFDWEAQCQFSGWFAFSNRQEGVDRIIEAYRTVGLGGEADAVRRAHSAWHDSGGDHSATSAAYSLVAHPYQIDLDRLEYLAAYFVDHADELLYLDAA